MMRCSHSTAGRHGDSSAYAGIRTARCSRWRRLQKGKHLASPRPRLCTPQRPPPARARKKRQTQTSWMRHRWIPDWGTGSADLGG
eukprot:3933586-Rhodomonas_salina.1